MMKVLWREVVQAGFRNVLREFELFQVGIVVVSYFGMVFRRCGCGWG